MSSLAALPLQSLQIYFERPRVTRQTASRFVKISDLDEHSAERVDLFSYSVILTGIIQSTLCCYCIIQREISFHEPRVGSSLFPGVLHWGIFSIRYSALYAEDYPRMDCVAPGYHFPPNSKHDSANVQKHYTIRRTTRST